VSHTISLLSETVLSTSSFSQSSRTQQAINDIPLAVTHRLPEDTRKHPYPRAYVVPPRLGTTGAVCTAALERKGHNKN